MGESENMCACKCEYSWVNLKTYERVLTPSLVNMQGAQLVGARL